MNLAIVIMAAGKGTRMKSRLPKVLHPVGGLPMLGHILATVARAGATRSVVVIGPGQDDVAAYATARGAETALQAEQRGTGDAANAGRAALGAFQGDVMVLYGDAPLLTEATLARLIAARRSADIVLLGFRPADPAPYGRLVVAEDGTLEAIVEAKDATPQQKAIGFCNAGGFLLDAVTLFALLADVEPNNAQGEYYLTDIVALGRRQGLRTVAVEAPETDVLGVNSRGELAAVEAEFQNRRRRQFMADSVTLADPASVWFAHDVVIGNDVTIGQNVVFGPGVTVASGVTIKPFCHIEGAAIAEGAVIGPFARLRPGTELAAGVHVGNFVETKNARLGPGVKANHLTYLGDADVGAGSNVGAGTITCNYDGASKHRTIIGDDAFIGSDTQLVAPVVVGEGATLGAGTTLTADAPAGQLTLSRARQTSVSRWKRPKKTSH